MSSRKRITKSVWLPAVIFIYFAAMACVYGPELISGGETLRFILISVAEVAMIIVLHLFLRHRERQERK